MIIKLRTIALSGPLGPGFVECICRERRAPGHPGRPGGGGATETDHGGIGAREGGLRAHATRECTVSPKGTLLVFTFL